MGNTLRCAAPDNKQNTHLCYQDYGALPLVCYQHKLAHLFCKGAAHRNISPHLFKILLRQVFAQAYNSNLTLK